MFAVRALLVVAVAAASQTGPPPAVHPIAIDVVVVPSGLMLVPDELSVSVDGHPRKVMFIRPILRGPGAERAAGEPGLAGSAPIAEPSRTMIVAVDQDSLSRGSEKRFSATIARVLDLIGPADRAALVPLPLERARAIAVGTERQPLWNALGRIRVGTTAAPLALARAEEAPPPDDEARDPRSAAAEERPGTERDRRPEPSRRIEADQEAAGVATGVLGEVRSLLLAIRDMPGSKILLIVRGTTAPETNARQDDRSGARLESVGLPQLAAMARATIHAVTLGDKWRGSEDEVGRLAHLTGGDEFPLGRQADRELQRLGTCISEGLRVAIEASPEDLDGRAHRVSVTTSRRDRALRAPERWLPFEAEWPPVLTGPAATTPPVGTPAGAGGSVLQADADLQRVLARMSSYVAQFVQDFSAVVAEESYEQKVTAPTGFRVVRTSVRKLRSDFLLVRVPGREEWAPFRDVFEVDGKAVRDRDDRLKKLFIDMPPDAFDKARRILDEAARYNIGTMYRNVNLPVLPLVFLMPRFVDGLQFRRADEEGVEGMRVWRVDFKEIGRPTVIRNDREDRDIPAEGSLWIEPATGRIVKTRIRIQDPTFKMDTTVLYRRSDTLHAWAPAEMEEHYSSGGEQITGSARYKNFRRFRVEVEEKIAVPRN